MPYGPAIYSSIYLIQGINLSPRIIEGTGISPIYIIQGVNLSPYNGGYWDLSGPQAGFMANGQKL